VCNIQATEYEVKSQVLTEETIKMTVFWDVSLHSLADNDLTFQRCLLLMLTG
jgi:hypothetical protein